MVLDGNSDLRSQINVLEADLRTMQSTFAIMEARYIAMDAKYEKLEAKLNQQCNSYGAEGDKDRNVTNVDGSYPKGKIIHNP